MKLPYIRRHRDEKNVKISGFQIQVRTITFLHIKTCVINNNKYERRYKSDMKTENNEKHLFLN